MRKLGIRLGEPGHIVSPGRFEVCETEGRWSLMNLNQVTMPSTNVKAAVEFYRRLELQQIVDGLPDYARFECPDGEGAFSLPRVERVPDGPGVVVYFECEELATCVEKVKSEGTP